MRLSISGGSDGTLLRTWHTSYNAHLAFSPDGKTLASAMSLMILPSIIWRVSDGMLLRNLSRHNGRIDFLAFSPNGQILASGSEDGTVKLWRVVDGILLHSLKSGGLVNPVAFSPDGKIIAASGVYGLLLWRVSDGMLLRRIKGAYGAFSLIFSPDGKYIAMGDANIQLWRSSDGILLDTIYGGVWEFSNDTFACLQPDGTCLAVGGGGICLWRLNDVAFRDSALFSNMIDRLRHQVTHQDWPQAVRCVRRTRCLLRTFAGAGVGRVARADVDTLTFLPPRLRPTQPAHSRSFSRHFSQHDAAFVLVFQRPRLFLRHKTSAEGAGRESPT